MFTDYALFDIRIRGAGPERYEVDVQSAIGGDAHGEFVSPASDSGFQQQIERLQALDTDEELLIEIGQRLFQALFVGGIKEVYTRSQGRLKPDQGLRLRFTIDPAQTALASLPWEFLYDPDQGPIVLLDAPIVRYLAQQAAPPVLESPLPLKVLLTGAVTPPQADVEREIGEVRAALQELEQSGHVKIHVEEHLTRTKLHRLLREGFRIWHFAGHGGLSRDKRSGALILEDNDGSPDAMSANELGIFLNRSGLQLILLDACDSGQLTTAPYRSIAPALMRAQVGAVVAMQFKVPTEATRPFAVEFYRALAEGFPIDACVTEGRKAVMAATGLYNPDWGIPVVYTRAPDGRLFAPPATPAKPGVPAEQGGGVNISLGDRNTLTGSPLTVQGVGNTTVSGNTFGSSGQDERAEEIQALRDLINTNRRRLNQRQLQAAKYGIGADPAITIEIEDLTREIAKLERELQKLGG
jgi:CHAT domain